MLSVCKELKSKESNSRDVARSTLGRIAVASGLKNFGVILRNLSITLSEGYQLHVRSATLHTCVLAFSQDDKSREEASKGGALDAWISEIIDLVQEDIFGMAAEMKETKDVGKRVIKEAVGVRSYDTVELLSGMVRFRPDEEGNAVRALVDPFIDRLNDEESKVNLAVIKKVAELLGKVVIGFSKNEDADSDAVLRYVLGLIKGVLGDGIVGKRKREQEEREVRSGEERSDELRSRVYEIRSLNFRT